MQLPLAFSIFVVIFFAAFTSVSGQGATVGADLNRPYKITRQPKAAYTDQARSSNVEGAVRLRITLLANGQVGSVTLVKTRGWQKLKRYGLVGRAMDAARQIEFIPKTVNGRSVSVIITREYTFEVY